jgi:hypothetical protein
LGVPPRVAWRLSGVLEGAWRAFLRGAGDKAKDHEGILRNDINSLGASVPWLLLLIGHTVACLSQCQHRSTGGGGPKIDAGWPAKCLRKFCVNPKSHTFGNVVKCIQRRTL